MLAGEKLIDSENNNPLKLIMIKNIMIKTFCRTSNIHMGGRVIPDQNDWLLNPLGIQHGREDR